MNDLLLKNCKLIDKSGIFNIGIENSKIAEISKQPLKADDEIDVRQHLILPGLIDPHVHFRDPGLTYKESFKTGSMSAAHGGFTTVIDMPNTIPPTNTAKNFKEKKKIAEKNSIIDFRLHAGINNLEELEKIAKLTPASFKIFMDLYSDSEIEDIFKNISFINKTLEKSIPITLHAENKQIVEENTIRMQKLANLSENSKESNNKNNAIDYSYARPSQAELVSVKYAINLAKKYDVPIHICHLTTKKALNYLKSIANSKENVGNNVNITTEISPHHLLLDNSAFNKFGTIAKTNPPLREKGENLTTIDLNNINMIGTDHAPHSLEEKLKGVWDSSPGIPNLETTLPLLLTEVNKGNIPLKMIPKLMSENPAKRFSMENKGKIELGYDADIIVVDLKREGKFNIDTFYTKAKYSPFKDYSYIGKCIMTISNGKLIMEEGKILV